MCLVCVLPWVCMLGLAFTPLLLTADVFCLCAGTVNSGWLFSYCSKFQPARKPVLSCELALTLLLPKFKRMGVGLYVKTTKICIAIVIATTFLIKWSLCCLMLLDVSSNYRDFQHIMELAPL